ncbi:ras association domain-containing protein 2 [Bufo gargarizans]|uniref:ras association domain-containing protein 2 n=1 Tax=Bufo gargarizans TaxID=30331 RepID=UPI001CF46B7E|nr:ras association domain-containing protein 2 [Bufo gargarizans]XP_044135196.1 ras association domain-containing protein 2 [Bufo gargarizans]XP_044135197.1 ras association domain-containing protein 2 [Bufo gargarizans]
MEQSFDTSLVPCGKDKYIPKNELLAHLKNYNFYYEGQNLQLRHREEEGELIIEGLLNIFWGLRRPIRLQMQDDHERIRPPPSSTSWHSGCNLVTEGKVATPATIPDIQVTEVEEAPADDDNDEDKASQDEAPQLMRTRSDVGVRRRGNLRTPGEQRRIRRHRFSINGHFYNHKTSVFTPGYGSVTNVRINSAMSTPQVLKLLLNKFKIENSASEFSLYVVHTSGEKMKLKDSDYPLIARILQGPCEQVSKVFLMEKDQVEEITYDVAQYIKFEMPVLSSFIEKLKEEEDREIIKLMRRYTSLRLLIEQQLHELANTSATM